MNSSPSTETAVLDALRQVIDPELGMNIVDLGLIYDVRIDGSDVCVAMTLTSAGCPIGESICRGAEIALLGLAGIAEARIELVFDPPWHPGMIAAPADQARV